MIEMCNVQMGQGIVTWLNLAITCLARLERWPTRHVHTCCCVCVQVPLLSPAAQCGVLQLALRQHFDGRLAPIEVDQIELQGGQGRRWGRVEVGQGGGGAG